VLQAFGGEDDVRGAGRSAAAAVPGLVEQLTAREPEILAAGVAGWSFYSPGPSVVRAVKLLGTCRV
jgi:hypothetical protein